MAGGTSLGGLVARAVLASLSLCTLVVVSLGSAAPVGACSVGAWPGAFVGVVLAEDGTMVTYEVTAHVAARGDASEWLPAVGSVVQVRYHGRDMRYLDVGSTYQVTSFPGADGERSSNVGRDVGGCGLGAATVHADGSRIDTSLVRLGPLNTKGLMVLAVVLLGVGGVAYGTWHRWESRKALRSLMARARAEGRLP